jgi:adenine-specific DNA-methyltransferase
LALVLPAELLSVNYAAGVREFLMRRFARVRLVLFCDRVFPGVQEEVVLVMAEGAGPTDHCELIQVMDVAELVDCGPETAAWRPPTVQGKWTTAMIPDRGRVSFEEALSSTGVSTLHAWGETTLGSVTGNNSYFAVSPERAAALGLDPHRDLVRISPPGSRHLRGLELSETGWAELGVRGKASWLFRPPGQPSPAARRYIATGEAEAVDEAYKCRVRSPWWRVPLVPVPDLFVTYMNADTPRLVTNRARVHYLNSVHGLHLHAGLTEDERHLARELLGLAALNSLTMLGAETVGRSYGGGVLKLEPREADQLPVPSPEVLARVAPALRAVRRQVAKDLAARERGPQSYGTDGLLRAVATVDRIVLVEGLGMAELEVAALAGAREALALRRASRSGDGGARGRR